MEKTNRVKVEESRFFSVYIHELWRLADEIKVHCEKIFEEAKIPDKGYLIQVSPSLHSNIMYVLINAANFKKLVFTPPDRFKNETKKVYEYRKERSHLLKQIITGLDISEIQDNKVRNTLEHFDDYLDKENIRFSGTKEPLVVPAAYNMTFSNWNVYNPKVYPIRLYISDERKFYNMGFSIDIGKIYDEATLIINRIHELGLFKNIDEPGGFLIVK